MERTRCQALRTDFGSDLLEGVADFLLLRGPFPLGLPGHMTTFLPTLLALLFLFIGAKFTSTENGEWGKGHPWLDHVSQNELEDC